MQYLRKAREELVHEFDTQHPFCHREILTDGRKVFIHVADELGEDEILKELISKQQAFPKVLLPLLAQVAYDRGSALARSWRIRPGIVIDPGRQYGKPIVSAAAIPTAVLAAAYYANARRTRIVADAYGIRPQHVRLAVGFEREFAGVAA